MTPLITFASSLSPALARFAVFLPRTSSRTSWRVKEIDSIIIMEKKKPSSSSARLLFTATSNTCSATTKCNKGAFLEEEEKTQTWEEYDQLDIQSMTINQLRTMSKKVGIPSRGSKHELLLALNCFLAKEKDGKISSAKLHVEVNTMDLQNVKSGKNSDEVHLQNSNISVSKFQLKKRKRKSLSVDDVHSGKVRSSNQVIEKESSVSVNVVSDTKLSIAKRKTSSPLVNGEGRVGIVENSIEPWTILVHKKPQQGWVPYNPKKMRPPPPVDGTESLKLISWNVNGLRALLRSEGISTFAQEEKFDILCLQETKLQEKDVENIKQCLINGYENSFWTCSVSKLGYSGCAIISRIKPLSVRYGLGILDHDTEGRLVTVEFDTFYLISGYVPNSGDGLKRLDYRVTQWDPSLSNYMKELEKSKPVILTGDLNCAHQEIDIFNPAGNRRSAGFTDEERESFQTNFLYRGFVDTFRRQHPDVVGYTYWGYRHRLRVQNKGWRLDYFLVSESVADKVHDSYICPHVTGSDHCPIGLILKL